MEPQRHAPQAERLVMLGIALMLVLTLIFVLLKILSAGNAHADTPSLRVQTIAEGLEHPWGVVFLPDGRAIVTERPGRMRMVSTTGTLSKPLKNVPHVYAEGQGGLLDVVLSPDFAEDRRIYFTYAERGEGDLAGTAVARAVLKHDRLENVEVIFRQSPKKEGDNHFGSRLAFAPDGSMFIGLGERFDYSEEAQDLNSHLGKVVRIRADGSVPEDNPFVGRKGALPEIWSYGHRNIQGMALNPHTEEIWIHEHGARGGDEINIPRRGKNYGWPEASYGSHYSFLPIEDDHKGQGFAEPVHYWTPSIAPSGMVFYTGDRYPGWRGNLFVGALAMTHLARLELEGAKVVKEEKLLEEREARIRDVEQGPDGYLYLLTDSDNGALLRLMPR